jgi:hypothetical protein
MGEQGEQEQRARERRAEPAELAPLTPLAHQVRSLKQARRWHCSCRGSRFEGICLFACPCWCRLRRLSCKGRNLDGGFQFGMTCPWRTLLRDGGGALAGEMVRNVEGEKPLPTRDGCQIVASAFCGVSICVSVIKAGFFDGGERG